MVIVARILAAPEQSAGRSLRSAGALPVRLTPLSATLQCAASRAAAGRNPLPEQSMGDLIQLRDYQNPRDIERMRQALEREAAEIMAQVETVPYHGAGIDGMGLEKSE
jgi:hypothetical protein